MITRNFFLYLSQQKRLRRWMETHPAARKLTQRYIAGITLDDELAVCAQLQSEGMLVALDHLGENVTSLEDAQGPVQEYLNALDEIAARKLPATVSLKLTQFGLDLSDEACIQNIRQLAAKAQATGSRVEIDMESSIYTAKTLRIAALLAAEFGHIRVVIQAYLYRSDADIARMNQLRIPVRLCKGAYNEPAEIAYPKKSDVDLNYIKLMQQLLRHGAYPAIATHDEKMVDATISHATEQGIAPDHFEFQMLYGIRRDLQKRVVAQGYRLRVYVPYGDAWYPYFMRRIGERPANLWFVVNSLWR
jgi:proline dehydrogenase